MLQVSAHSQFILSTKVLKHTQAKSHTHTHTHTQGDLSTMWNGPFSISDTTGTSSTQKKGYQQVGKYSLLPV